MEQEQKQMKIQPGRGWYSVVPIEPKAETASGLFLTDSIAKGAAMTVGVVRAIGVNDYLKSSTSPNSEQVEMQAKVGDVIHYSQAATAGIIDADDSPLVFVRDENIIAIFHGIDPETMRAAPGGKVALPSPADLRLVNGKHN